MTTFRAESPSRVAWKRLKKNKGAVVAMAVLLIMIFAALCAPWITPFDPTTQVLEYSVKPAGFTGLIFYKINPSDSESPSIVAVRDYQVRGDSVYYHDPAGEAYVIARSALVGDRKSVV